MSDLAAGLRADHADRVRALFDGKAAGWPAKYAPGGPLAGRLASLASAVRAVAAPGAQVLDLGCGSGEFASWLAAAGYRVTGCDISPQMLRAAQAAHGAAGVSWRRLDPGWQRLPLASASLDAVVMSSVLEYVHDPVAVLRECSRVLRPAGVVVCTVPALAHPVRWLEWPLGRAARSWPAAGWPGAHARVGPYLAYLRASRQRRRVRWWRATGAAAGLQPVRLTGRTWAPLRLLVFARQPSQRGGPFDTVRGQP